MTIPSEVREILRRRDGVTRIAVVGASERRDKYGHIIVTDLREKEFEVLPVNPKLDEIDGLRVYHNVGDLPERVDIVDFVVPADVGREVIRQLDPARVDVVWFQPGASDDALVEEARGRFRHVIADDCIMVATRTGYGNHYQTDVNKVSRR